MVTLECTSPVIFLRIPTPLDDRIDTRTMRIIVCGGRDFKDRALCYDHIEHFIGEHADEVIEIVSGHARGADTFAEDYAAANGLRCKVFAAEWDRYGRAAGPIRNRQMMQYASEENGAVLAFWDGKSKGTKNMIGQAQKAGMTVKIVYYGASE